MIKLGLIFLLAISVGYIVFFVAFFLATKVSKKHQKHVDPDDTLTKPLPDVIREEERAAYLNTGRMKLRKITLGHRAVDPEGNIEMEVSPEILEPKKAEKGRLVVYSRDPRQHPFGYFLGTDRSGRIRVKRFDNVFVRRSPGTVVVLA